MERKDRKYVLEKDINLIKEIYINQLNKTLESVEKECERVSKKEEEAKNAYKLITGDFQKLKEHMNKDQEKFIDYMTELIGDKYIEKTLKNIIYCTIQTEIRKTIEHIKNVNLQPTIDSYFKHDISDFID